MRCCGEDGVGSGVMEWKEAENGLEGKLSVTYLSPKVPFQVMSYFSLFYSLL